MGIVFEKIMMKITVLVLCVFFFAKISSQEDSCLNTYTPVVGEDGHCYLNSCWAKEAGTEIRKDSIWKEKDYKKKDTLTWFIHRTCTPIRQNEMLRNLGDGTYIYSKWDTKEIYRGIPNRCRCLSKGSLIETSTGVVEVEKIKVGDLVKTVDNGDTVYRKVIVKHIENVSKNHKVALVKLVNGNQIKVSPSHPQLNYVSNLENLKKGDLLDGQLIKSIRLIKYKEPHTYDLLLEGNTGSYWVNGVRVGSKLFFSSVVEYR